MRKSIQMLQQLINYNYDIIYENIRILILFILKTIRFFPSTFIIQHSRAYKMEFQEHTFGVVIHYIYYIGTYNTSKYSKSSL